MRVLHALRDSARHPLVRDSARHLLVCVTTLVLALMVQHPRANAATITVGVGCSLAQAIQAANGDVAIGACAAGSGQDTIQVPPGVITFGAAFSPFTDPNTALPLIVGPTTIVGAGKDLTILRRDPLAPSFRFLNLDATVTLEGLGFEGGKIPATTYGSAIAGHGGTLTITDCAFIGNDASDTGLGGAIGMSTGGSTLVVGGSTFEGNVGRNSAIYQPRGAAHIHTSTFQGNEGPSGGNFGGVVYVQAQTEALVEFCTFADNDVGVEAFVLYVSSGNYATDPGTVTVRETQFLRNTSNASTVYFGPEGQPGNQYMVDGCIFEDNVVTGAGASALFVYNGVTRIERSIFTRNTAPVGGAAYLQANGTDTVTISDTVFDDNFAYQAAGAVYVTGNGQTFIGDSSFTRNRSTGQNGSGSSCGGAIAVHGYVEIERSRFDSNSTLAEASFVATTNATESGTTGILTLQLEAYGSAICSPSGVSYVVSESCFVGNTRTAVYGAGDARNNWWGAADGPARASGVGTGDTSGTDVSVSPFLTAAPAGCTQMTPLQASLTVNVDIGGTATPIDDYTTIPAPPFQVAPHIGRLPIAIVAVNDALVEGNESVAMAALDGVGYRPYGSGGISIIDDGTGCGASCDDGVACTTDVCEATLVCSHTPKDAACDDGKACTVDSCDPLTGCKATPDDAACDDDNVCTTDTCTVGIGCTHPERFGTCDDEDPCTTGSTCTDGICGGGIAIPGCETRKIDLGAPFGEVALPVPALGDVCFSGTKVLNDCAPFGHCELTVEACFYPEETVVDVLLDTQVAIRERVEDIELVGGWRPNGFCLVGALPSLLEGPVQVESGTLIACWDGGGEGFVAAHATASAEGAGAVLAGLSVAVDGTLRTTPGLVGVPKISGCLSGEVLASAVFPGLPGTFSTQANLSFCLGGGSLLGLDEWRPFPDDPGTVARDVKGRFFKDAVGTWSVKIDHALDPILGFCRFILKAGTIAGQKVGTKWLLTLTGTASFDFAGQHVEAGISAVLQNGTLSLSLSSSADLSLYLKHGDPQEDGILVQAKKKLQKNVNLNLQVPSLPTMKLACSAPETTVEIYGLVSVPFCDQSLTASVKVSGSLGEPGFRMEGTASIIGGIGLPLPLILPGLPSLPGPYCLGLASEPRLEWTVCGAPPPPEGGLWLHTTTELELFGSDPAEIELRVGIDPPNTAGAYATLAAPVELIGPEDHFPGVASLTLGASEISLHIEACNVEDSGLSFVTEATEVTTDGHTIAYSVAAEATLVRQSAKLTSKSRWLDAYGLQGLGIESGSVLAISLGLGDRADERRFGQRDVVFFKTAGDWPPPVAAGGEICDDLPAVDNDGDGKVNCADSQCANHLMCRAAVDGAGVIAARAVIYIDLKALPGVLGVRVPGLAVRFDLGDSTILTPLTIPLTPADIERAFVGALTAPARDDGSARQNATRTIADIRETYKKLIRPTIILVALLTIAGVSGGLHLPDPVAVGQFVDALGLSGDPPPDLCDRLSLGCPPGGLSIAPAALYANAISMSFATRDVVFDDLRIAAGFHVEAKHTTPTRSERLAGSLGSDPPGLSLAGSVEGTPGSLVTLFDLSPPAALGWSPLLRVALSGDPYDRVARGPAGGGGFIRTGPNTNLDFARAGTVEGFVTRGTWSGGAFDGLLAARYGTVGGTTRGWKVGIGDGYNTTWGRVTFETSTLAGVSTRAQTLLPVVPPNRRTHVAVTWNTVTVDGQEILDVGIYVDGQRQQAMTTAGGVRVPAIATGQQLMLGANLGTLDDFRLWNEARSSQRIAGEAELLTPASAADTGLLVRYEFDNDLGSVATNLGAAGSALAGVFVSGVTTASEINAPVIAARIIAGPAGESAGLHALAGLTITTPAGSAPFRLEARAEGGDVTGSLLAVEVPLVPLGSYGTLCLRDVRADADLKQRDTTGQATLALCRPDGNRTLGAFGMQIRCPAGQICPPGLVLGVNGPLGDTTLNLGFRLFLNGNLKADTDTGEVVITGRLGWGVQTFDGTLRWSRDRLTIDTSYDLPPFAPGLPDPGPATLHLVHDLVANTLCGTGQASLPGGVPCEVDVCFQDGPGGGITGTTNCAFPTVACTTSSQCGAGKMCVAGACVPKLIDGAPCANAGMCQSGNCATLCYTPNSLPLAAPCVVSNPDPCAGEAVCIAPVCNVTPLFPCPSASCVLPVAAGQQCVGQAQCPAGTTCRKSSDALFSWSTRYCLWPDDSRELGQQCRGSPECTSDLCVLTQCVCGDDADCGSGKLCVASACVPTPPVPKLPGQACTADNQCAFLKCVSGTCGCKVSSDCGASSKYCANPSLGVLPVGVCTSKLDDGQACVTGEMCSHQSCAGLLRPPTCYGTSSASLDAECVANDQCNTGKCQIACAWGGQCSPFNAGQPPGGCTCTTRCSCSNDSHCGSSKFCSAFTFAGQSVSGMTKCLDKLGANQVCERDAQCANGDCQSSTFCTRAFTTQACTSNLSCDGLGFPYCVAHVCASPETCITLSKCN